MATSSTAGLYRHLVEAQRARSSLFRFAASLRRRPVQAVRNKVALAGPSLRDLTPDLEAERRLALGRA